MVTLALDGEEAELTPAPTNGTERAAHSMAAPSFVALERPGRRAGSVPLGVPSQEGSLCLIMDIVISPFSYYCHS